MQIHYPKITIVTPVFNQVDYIEATIKSVVAQNYPNLEYIVIDGGSTDGTVEIIKKYESQLATWISEPDDGMYHALNKGFALSSGEIMCWINGDDLMLTYSLFNMFKLFRDLPQVNWIQGINSIISVNGDLVHMQIPKKITLISLLNNDQNWIQQESTFWRRGLWQKSGARLRQDLKLAGDFELWLRYFQFEKLYYVNIPIGGWRMRPGQLSISNKDLYLNEVDSVLKNHKIKKEVLSVLNKIKRLDYIIEFLKFLKLVKLNYFINLKIKFSNLAHIEIVYSHKSQKFTINQNK